jgi:hypothetical protein
MTICNENVAPTLGVPKFLQDILYQTLDAVLLVLQQLGAGTSVS